MFKIGIDGRSVKVSLPQNILGEDFVLTKQPKEGGHLRPDVRSPDSGPKWIFECRIFYDYVVGFMCGEHSPVFISPSEHILLF